MISLNTGTAGGFNIDVSLGPAALGNFVTHGKERNPGNLIETGVEELDEQLNQGVTRIALTWLLAGCPDKEDVIERYFRLRESEENDGYLLFSRIDPEKFEDMVRSQFKPGLHKEISLEMIRQHAREHIANGTLLRGAILPNELIDRTEEIISRRLIRKLSIHSDVMNTTITLDLYRLPELTDFPLVELNSRSKGFLFSHQMQQGAEIDGIVPSTLTTTPHGNSSRSIVIDKEGSVTFH